MWLTTHHTSHLTAHQIKLEKDKFINDPPRLAHRVVLFINDLEISNSGSISRIVFIQILRQMSFITGGREVRWGEVGSVEGGGCWFCLECLWRFRPARMSILSQAQNNRLVGAVQSYSGITGTQEYHWALMINNISKLYTDWSSANQ